jgi:hypothetical protein
MGSGDVKKASTLRQDKINFLKWDFLDFLEFFYVRYSTLLHLPTLRFNCVGGCWDRTQDCCDFGIDSQTPYIAKKR